MYKRTYIEQIRLPPHGKLIRRNRVGGAIKFSNYKNHATAPFKLRDGTVITCVYNKDDISYRGIPFSVYVDAVDLYQPDEECPHKPGQIFFQYPTWRCQCDVEISMITVDE